VGTRLARRSGGPPRGSRRLTSKRHSNAPQSQDGGRCFVRAVRAGGVYGLRKVILTAFAPRPSCSKQFFD